MTRKYSSSQKTNMFGVESPTTLHRGKVVGEVESRLWLRAPCSIRAISPSSFYICIYSLLVQEGKIASENG